MLFAKRSSKALVTSSVVKDNVLYVALSPALPTAILHVVRQHSPATLPAPAACFRIPFRPAAPTNDQQLTPNFETERPESNALRPLLLFRLVCRAQQPYLL